MGQRLLQKLLGILPDMPGADRFSLAQNHWDDILDLAKTQPEMVNKMYTLGCYEQNQKACDLLFPLVSLGVDNS